LHSTLYNDPPIFDNQRSRLFFSEGSNYNPFVNLEEGAAWLESQGRDRIVIRGNCSLGRSPKSAVVLDSPKVSRRHAIINLQNVGEFWLIDLGSSNGTFLNKRRVHQPVRLCDMDQITVGDTAFTFRQPEEISNELRTTMAQQTIRETANIPVWLLVADIENFTPLSRSMVSDKLATLVGGWVAACKEIVEEHHGEIDKYLGDGFLAYWHDDEKSAENVAAGLQKLKQLQRMEPRFRLVLHHGLVSSGGMRSMGEESLIGKEVIFVFRMEKLAGSLGILLLASAAAKAKLEPVMKYDPAGVHELKGFEGSFEFFKG
jgi:adenylate cyclase